MVVLCVFIFLCVIFFHCSSYYSMCLDVIVTMTDRNITLIKNLDNMNDDYTPKVFIIWLWKSILDVNRTIVKSIELILMDEMCTKIRASVYPRDFQRFESKLKEDQFVYIRSPTISPNRYTFKISDVKDKLNFHGRITVNECLHFQSKTTYKFSCVSFETIISTTTTSNDSIDVIGEVVSLGKLDSRDVNKSRHRLPLQIRNLDHNAKNVVDLLEPQEVGRFIIVGTNYGIQQDIDWYYNACANRGKKVDARNVFSGPESGDESVVYQCYSDKCIKKEISYVPRLFTFNKIANRQLKYIINH
uniref:Replication protein A 70 kDa DNA-binding subunit B/D first OB fold domain-containing protein n=1 Tax=Lactuca sativa TaxID=4236 RepID=A0A9R1VEY3_LACSA|nr:hypothetical protein LSAT_V11C500228750 [Lactuca sativa]